MLVSETYSLWDCIVYDNCTETDHNDSIWDLTNITLTRGSDYSTITQISTSNIGTAFIGGLNDDCTVDFDYYQSNGVQGNGFINIYSATAGLTYFQLSHLGLDSTSIGTWIPLRLRITDGSATLTVRTDSTKTRTNSFTGTPSRVRFVLSSTAISEMRFKNIRIY